MIILHYLGMALAASFIGVVVLVQISTSLYLAGMYLWFVGSIFWALFGPAVKRLIAFVRR